MNTTMYVTYAYIDRNTRWDDVDFYKSHLYDSIHLWEYVRHVVTKARSKHVRILEFTVYQDGKEIWRGNF